MLNFLHKFRTGRLQLPKCIRLLNKLKKDGNLVDLQSKVLQQNLYKKKRQAYDIEGFYNYTRMRTTKDKLMMIKQQLMQFQEVPDLDSPTTLHSRLRSSHYNSEYAGSSSD